MTRRKNMGLGSFPRQTAANFEGCYFMDLQNNSDSFYSDIIDDLDGNGNDNLINDEGGGVSTILIEINENE